MVKEKAKEYSKAQAIKILYKAFLEKGERLDSKEITTEKNLFTTKELMNIFGTSKAKTIWEMVDAKYEIDSARTEKHRLELIKEMQDMYKTVQPFTNKTVPRVFRNKMERFFGSWVEAMLVSGLTPHSIIPETLSTSRKDLILENLINLVFKNKKIPLKADLSKHNRLPNMDLYKAIYGMSWSELTTKLELDEHRWKAFCKLSSNILFDMFKQEMKRKQNKDRLLTTYSLNISEEAFPFIYYVERFEINWEYMLLLMDNDFKSVKDNMYVSNDELINILTFKYLLNGRQLRVLEVDNDPLIPSTNVLMALFNKGMYEIWLMVEENSKAYY